MRTMADLNFEKESTGLLIIDPYNDFISEGGKLWDRINPCVRYEMSPMFQAAHYAMHRDATYNLYLLLIRSNG